MKWLTRVLETFVPPLLEIFLRCLNLLLGEVRVMAPAMALYGSHDLRELQMVCLGMPEPHSGRNSDGGPELPGDDWF